MIYYDYIDFKHDLQPLSRQCETFQADTILAVARGGMTVAHALAMSLNIRNVQSIRIESYDGEHQRDNVTIKGKCDFTLSKKVLIVDDIIDSGKTLYTLLPRLHSEYPEIVFAVAVLFSKATALIQPDFSLHEATDWIDFFWERDFLKSDLI